MIGLTWNKNLIQPLECMIYIAFTSETATGCVL